MTQIYNTCKVCGAERTIEDAKQVYAVFGDPDFKGCVCWLCLVKMANAEPQQ